MLKKNRTTYNYRRFVPVNVLQIKEATPGLLSSQTCSACFLSCPSFAGQGRVNLLLQNNIAISMTENGDPYENALAERMNGIIKTEFNLKNSQLGIEQINTDLPE
jgi:hypothetical protein